MSNLDKEFPSRLSLRYSGVLDSIRKLDSSNGVEDRKVESKVTQKQGTFSYIRVYLDNEDVTLVAGDKVTISYPQDNESIDTVFVSYGKDVGKKRENDELVDYVPESDNKVLCLMIDVDKINYNSDHIPFIRSLFRVGRYYQYQLFKYEEIKISSKNKDFSFFDIDFG